jgi:hypothetical protein
MRSRAVLRSLVPLSFVLALGCSEVEGNALDALGLAAADGGVSGDGRGDGSGAGDGASGDGSGGGDGAAGSGDGALGGADGGLSAGSDGSPLGEPLSTFCGGSGAPVVVGGGDLCSGELAEGTFRFAVCACETVDVQSNLSIDGFDSRLGPYGAALPGGGNNISADGQLGTNAALQMDGKLDVAGSVYVGPGYRVGPQSEVGQTLYTSGDAEQPRASCSVGGNTYVRGDLSGRYSLAGNLQVPAASSISPEVSVGGRTIRAEVPVIAPCACQPSELLDLAALIRFGRDHNDNAVRRVITATTWSGPGGPSRVELPCGRYFVERLVTDSGLTLIATGRVVLYVAGDMTIGGGLDIRTTDGGELDLFVGGDLSVQAAARFGSEAAPASVRTYVGGSGDIVMPASTTFGGFVYAPRARLALGASAELFGGVFVRRASFAGSASVHYDTAVRSASAPCAPDGGVAAGDGGVAVRDGGMAGADAATSTGDGGPASGDSGTRPDATPSADAGARDSGPAPSGCACGSACGTLACVEGQCVACQSDLDCCAPFACLGGQCLANF